MTDITSTAAMIATKTGGDDSGGGGGSSEDYTLVSKTIEEYWVTRDQSPVVCRAASEDPPADGYDTVECEAYFATGYGDVYDNGVHHAYDYDSDYVGYYDGYVEVPTMGIPIRQGTAMEDISKVICYRDVVVDSDMDMGVEVGTLDFYIAMFTTYADGGSIGREVLAYIGNNWVHYPYDDTIKWELDPTTGTIKGSVTYPPFPYSGQGRYLGHDVIASAYLKLEQEFLIPGTTNHYDYPEGREAYGTFEASFSYLEDFGDTSHQMYIKNG